MKQGMRGAALALAGVVMAGALQAAPIAAPVPSNAIAQYGDLEWAWASPCRQEPGDCSRIDLGYQATLGWRLPTAREVADHIASDIAAFVAAFFYRGANDTNGVLQFACASAWFDVSFRHCDVRDAETGAIWNLVAGQGFTAYETFVVRDGEQVSPVPVPAAGFLLVGALGGLAAMRRARKG